MCSGAVNKKCLEVFWGFSTMHILNMEISIPWIFYKLLNFFFILIFSFFPKKIIQKNVFKNSYLFPMLSLPLKSIFSSHYLLCNVIFEKIPTRLLLSMTFKNLLNWWTVLWKFKKFKISEKKLIQDSLRCDFIWLLKILNSAYVQHSRQIFYWAKHFFVLWRHLNQQKKISFCVVWLLKIFGCSPDALGAWLIPFAITRGYKLQIV